ncbi:MAG: hypothetical protein RLW62_10910 [Gammaproteobacteria bacterium]
MHMLRTIALTLACGVGGAQAATLTATPLSFVPGWTAEFTDNGDGLFSLDEMTSFTGFEFAGNFLDQFIFTPSIPGVALQSGTPPSPAATDFLRFGATGGNEFGLNPTSFWSYTNSAAQATVPLPGGLPLLLGALGFAARRRRSAAHG